MLDTSRDSDFEDLLLDLPGGGEEALRCAACGALVTRESERIEVEGAHRHEFANPAGKRFRIGCFGAAPGALARGAPTRFWSWFEGHAWRVALCRGCGVQLGWRFVSPDGEGFFGLILDALAEGSGDGQPGRR